MKLFILMLVPMLSMAQYKFSNESELSMIKNTGNTESEAYNAKTKNVWEKNKNSYTLSGHYTYGKATTEDGNGNEVEALNARNWDIALRYARTFSKKISGFVGGQIEGDVFSFEERRNYDLGSRYIFTKSEKLNSLGEFGYRRTEQENLDGTQLNYSSLRLFYEISKQQTETFSWKFWVEYLPNLDESEDYQINYEPSISVAMNKTFSLKVAYRVMYDNVPNVAGNERTDAAQTTSLIAKF